MKLGVPTVATDVSEAECIRDKMTARANQAPPPPFTRDGWTVNTYEGQFSPMAFGPKNICLDVNDDGTITIEHEVPSGYGHSTSTERVTVPRDWLAAMLTATDEYRARKGEGK